MHGVGVFLLCPIDVGVDGDDNGGGSLVRWIWG